MDNQFATQIAVAAFGSNALAMLILLFITRNKYAIVVFSFAIPIAIYVLFPFFIFHEPKSVYKLLQEPSIFRLWAAMALGIFNVAGSFGYLVISYYVSRK